MRSRSFSTAGAPKRRSCDLAIRGSITLVAGGLGEPWYARRQNSGKRSEPKTVLRLTDFEQSKTAVLNSLPAASFQESYGDAIDEFISSVMRQSKPGSATPGASRKLWHAVNDAIGLEDI